MADKVTDKMIWEFINADGSTRGKVPGGWIINTPRGSVFFEDPSWQWVFPGDVIPPVPPTPTPTPTPTPAPTGKSGTITKPTTLQGYKFDGSTTYVCKFDGTTEGNKAAMFFDLPDLPYGSELDVNVERGQDYPWSANEKIFRAYKGQVGLKPNWYFGSQKDWKTTNNGMILYPELVDPVSIQFDANGKVKGPWSRAYIPWPVPDGKIRAERWQLKYNSGVGKADGWFRLTLDKKVLFEADQFQTDCAATPGCADVICIQDVPANLTPDEEKARAGGTSKIVANTLSVKYILP